MNRKSFKWKSGQKDFSWITSHGLWTGVVLDYAWIGEPMNHTRKTPSITTHEKKDWDPERGRKAKQNQKKQLPVQMGRENPY